MKVIFSHGKESGPDGKKINALMSIAESLGFFVESIDYRDLHCPEKRVERLCSRIGEDEQTILVGSSMGGYVSVVASINRPIKGLFLLAPALFMGGYKVQDYSMCSSNATIIHGWNDDVIPYNNSVRFSEENESSLVLINGNHSLDGCVEELSKAFRLWLEGCKKE